MRFLVLALALALPFERGIGQSATTFTVRSLMSADEFQKAGLQKLSAAELAVLDAWFLNTTAHLVTNISRAQIGARMGSATDLSQLEGATIVAEDGTFLGKITTNSVDRQSIGNEIGPYGSAISRTSIFNEIGRYGSEISSMSPFNSITSTPPRIFLGSQFVAFLTVNTIKSPRVDPRALIGWLKSNE